MARSVSLFIFLFFTTFVLQAQDKRIEQLDSLYTSLYKSKKLSGNVLIAEKGVVLYKKSFGNANESTKEPLNEHTIFELASCSKQFTAMAIALLNKQGKLKYDDEILKYIPELNFYKGVTIRHLVNHTSGLPDYMMLMDSVWDKSKIATNNDVITIFQKYQPAVEFEPNKKFEYSNTGYALLASIVERASKMSYGEYLKKNIFKPLKMERTFVYNRRYKPMKVDNYALGYVYGIGNNRILPDSSADDNYVIALDGIVGDGTVNSTVNDLLLWDRALYTEKLLSKEQMKEVFAPATLSNGKPSKYGFGWILDEHKDFGKIYLHSGSWPGYVTYIERHVDNDKTIILLNNLERSTMPMKAIRNILYNRPVIDPIVKRTEIKLADEVLAQYVGEYELAPEFIIKITQSGSQLKTQATGQGAIDIYPEAEDKFFLKVVDAQLEFIENDKGAVEKLILHQGGRDTEGLKIK